MHQDVAPAVRPTTRNADPPRIRRRRIGAVWRLSCTHFQPDFDALRAASTRIVVGVGAESGETLAARAEGRRRAARAQPGHVSGGPRRVPRRRVRSTGKPDAFAETLREILAG
jgi:hypothetical protein